MLQNGTIINGNLIEKPKSFRTACTVATQISAQVASSQFGGQTMTLAHLSPFIEVSRQKIKDNLEGELKAIGAWETTTERHFEGLVEHRLRQEISDGVQTIQYQLETLSSTNGQSPFITIHMDLNEVPEGQSRDDLAMLIEEVLEQRILGVKNEKGVYVAPAFPKLTYVLDEGVNVNEEDPYFYLTELSAYCSTKRLVPDYISAKKMREYKEGNVYPPMGKCRCSPCKTL